MMQNLFAINSTSECGLRPVNEDAVWSDAVAGWVAVIDGIGGPGKGDLAAGFVCASLARAVAQEGPIADRVEDALREANQAMLARPLSNPTLKGLGASVTVVVLDGSKLLVWHAGDTRLYAVRQGKSQLLTEDHNLAAFLVKQRQITPEQATTHPGRHTLLRSLGKDANLKLDTTEFQVQTGDRFVLASDGCYVDCPEAVWDEQMRARMRLCDAEALVRGALDNGSQDNATAIVVDMVEPLADDRRRAANYFPKIERLEVFLEFSNEAIKCVTVAHLYELLLQYTLRISNTERALVLTQADNGQLTATAKRGVADFVDTRSFAESHVRRVMETGTSFWSEDLTSDPSVDMTKSVSALSLRSIICVPLEGSQPVQSVLYADRAGTSAAFSRQDFELLSALVLYARLFQQNTQLHDTQRRQFAHLQYLHRLNSLVANQLDPAEIYRQVLAMCVTISQAERGYILVGPTFQGRASVDAAGKPVAPEAFDQALLDEVRQTAKPVLRVTAPSAGAQSHLGLDLRTILCVPLVVRQRFLGVVYLSANSLTVSFEPDDVNLINDLAQQAALHLEAALLHDELRRHNAEMENVLNQLTGTAAGGGSTSGSVAALGGLHFLLRRLMSEGRSGTVQVNAAGASGAVTLADGVIVQAGSSRWELVGDEALAELFSWREGEWFWVERPSQGRRDMEKKDFLFLAELRFAQRWMAINGYLSPDSKPVRLAAAQAGLSEPELHVLGLVTKGRTALELAQASHMPFREALDHLLALEAASLLAWSPIA